VNTGTGVSLSERSLKAPFQPQKHFSYDYIHWDVQPAANIQELHFSECL